MGIVRESSYVPFPLRKTLMIHITMSLLEPSCLHKIVHLHGPIRLYQRKKTQ